MNKRSQLVFYVMLVIIIFAAIFIIWAIDTGKLAGSADVAEPAITSASELQSLPATDKSTFGDLFSKVADWFQ